MSSKLEVILTSGAHASLGIAMGQLIDNYLSPATVDDLGRYISKGPLRELAEVVGQFAFGTLLMAEAMDKLLPASDTYKMPIGDGIISVFFYLVGQPKMIFKTQRLIAYALKDLLLESKSVLHQAESAVSPSRSPPTHLAPARIHRTPQADKAPARPPQ